MALYTNGLNLSRILDNSSPSNSINNSLITNMVNCHINLITVNSITSTNTALKLLAEGGVQDKTVLIADRQTGGRGRIGKSFHSPDGGIYMSVLLRNNYTPSQLNYVTPAIAVAVANALKKYREDIKIKWVNDLYLNDKKICGILTESAMNQTMEFSDYIIVGIGINLFEPQGGFVDDIKYIAGCLFSRNEKENINKELIISDILNSLFELVDNLNISYIIDQYKKHSYLDGKRVSVLRGSESFNATALGLDENLNLMVKSNSGEIITLCSGEVSIKPNTNE